MTQQELQSFNARFLAGIAGQLGVPYSLFTQRAPLYDCYSSPRMAAVRRLLDRAAAAMVGRQPGWRRKLKRARRIQREACGPATSNVWFTLTWEFAVERELKLAVAARNAAFAIYIDVDEPA